MRPQVLTLNRFLMALLVLAFATPAGAVELTGQVRGEVVDGDGLSIPGVLITVRSDAMQGVKQAETDGNGRFRVIALPVGDYQITTEKAAFHPARIDARINAGLTTTIALELQPATSAEELIVIDTAPVVDVTSTQSGTVVTKEMLRDIPNPGRDYQGATSFSPGVVGGGNPNMRGALSYGNQYYVDGVNTTDPLTNTFSMNMNIDAIEEVQVITGGMDAEYGRAMGGAVNVVTRSGGNTFEGDAQILYSSTATQVYDKLPEEVGVPKPETADQMAALNLGGPLIKDKLWFFTGVQLSRNIYTPALTDEQITSRPINADTGKTYDVPSRDWRSTYVFGKLTWKPNANHRLWLHGQADPTNIENSESNAYTLPSAETWWQQGGWLASLGHQWTPNPRTIIDTQLSTSNSYIRYRPKQWHDCETYTDAGFCEDDFTDDLGAWSANDPDGYAYGPAAYAYYTERERNSLVFAVTRFANLLGEHQLKLGVQADTMSSRSVYPGLENGIAYYDHNGEPDNLEGYTPNLLLKYDNDGDTTLSGSMVGVYVQDAWQPVPWLTLRPGVRFDYSDFKNNLGDSVYSTFTIAPRFGGAIDLTNDGRTKLHGYWGRFYDSGFLEISDTLSKDTSGYSYYYWDDRAGDWSADASFTSADSFLVHDDLQTPYSDEIDVGLTRDLGGGWAGGVVFTHEKTNHMFEDDEVNLIWNEDGTRVIGSRDGTGEAYYRLRTPDEATTTYTSVELTANKQFDEKWGMLSSYTWSNAQGRARDDQAQGLASASFDIPEQQPYETGLMPYDVPHAVKVAGSYRDAAMWSLGNNASLGLLGGWNFVMRSGYPYRPVYYNETYGDWYNYHESIDGTYRLPAYSRTDLKGGVTVAVGRTTWDLTAEVFNAFNSRGTTDVYTTADDGDGDDSNGNVYTDADGEVLFGQVASRQSPRYFQFGIRGEF